MKIINVKIDKLKPAKYNPRLNLQPEDKEYRDIKRSIIEFGLVEPLVINKDYIVVSGHQRLKVLKELSFTTVPCITVDLDKQKEKMLNIALNKISGDWDRAKLKDILEELDTGEFDVSLTGFGEQEIEDLMTEFQVEEIDVGNYELSQNPNDVYGGNSIPIRIGNFLAYLKKDDKDICGYIDKFAAKFDKENEEKAQIARNNAGEKIIELIKKNENSILPDFQ